jgi:hypothetical protein
MKRSECTRVFAERKPVVCTIELEEDENIIIIIICFRCSAFI